METTGHSPLACIGNPICLSTMLPRIDVKNIKHRAICIARLEPIKGHTHLLSAWKILQDRGFHYELDLVGEGSLRPQLEAQRHRDGLEDAVHFRGFTSDVSSFISNALFAILVSEVEGKPLVALEAAAMGRPTLLNAVPGSVDVLPPQRRLRNGLKWGDVNGLADALEEWFRNPEDVVQEGRHFFDFLVATSDPAVVAREYEALYQRIVTRSAQQHRLK